MAENYNGMAVGIFELDSFAACFVALDAASKAANIRIQNIERNRLGAGACVKMRGSVSDVNAAMDVALRTAEPIAKVVSHTVIASPAHDTAWTAAVTADTSPVIKTVSCPPHLPFQVRKDTSAVFSIWSITITALLLPTTSTNPNAPYLITESSFHYSI